MADVTTRFKSFLQADSSIAAMVAARVFDNHVNQQTPMPYVWFRKRQATNSTTLDSANGEVPNEFAFDVECVHRNRREAEALAELVRARCNCYRGTFGDSTCQAIFVNDQSDDYQPYNVGGDSGPFVTSLDLQVFV